MITGIACELYISRSLKTTSQRFVVRKETVSKAPANGFSVKSHILHG